jgi:hypothetical protein
MFLCLLKITKMSSAWSSKKWQNRVQFSDLVESDLLRGLWEILIFENRQAIFFSNGILQTFGLHCLSYLPSCDTFARSHNK